MTTFGGLNIAYSGLVAARAALETTGQNVANANTAGYTRQRVDQSAAALTRVVSNTVQTNYGDGVTVNGITRMNDSIVDARVRSTAGGAAYWSTTSDALATVETTLGEPSTTGLSSTMSSFFSSWGQMASHTGDAATANTLIKSGQLVAAKISSGYTAVADAWTDARSAASSATNSVNTAATKVADLNRTIRELSVTGANVNSLLDERDAAVATLAKLTGATTRDNTDGTIDVVIGGNAVVSGVSARKVVLTGTADFSAVASNPVTLRWADTNSAVSIDGGELAARIATLRPADSGGTGTGGVYAEAAKVYDDLARTISDSVNAVHTTGTTSTGAIGLAFFSVAATGSAALSLAVVPTGVAGIAAADGTKGNLDNTIADRIGQIGTATTVTTASGTTASPNAAWTTAVARIGSQASAATARASSATTAANAATTAQTSTSGVDLDEETSNLVMFQHAYQANARVLSTINDILDTLINMGAR